MISVLLVTPSEGFGELICQTLEDEGRYQVIMVESSNEALEQKQSFSLAILDCDADDSSLADLGHHLFAQNPELRLIVVPPRNNPEHPTLANLTPHGYLTKPFYLPDLLGLVENTLQGESPIEAAHTQREKTPAPVATDMLERPAPPEQDNPLPQQESHPTPEGDTAVQLPPWLQDVNRAAQHLTRLSLETSAQAALITRSDLLYAYAGGYPENVAHELADAVSHYWGRQGGSDLARFIRLDATGEEYMLYATALPGDMVLSLVFDAKTPFSQIRSQANHLAQRLASGPKDESSMSLSDSQPVPVPPKTETPTVLPFDWLPNQDALDDALDDPSTFEEDIPSDWQPVQPPSGERRSFLEELLPDLLPTAPLPYEDEETVPNLEKTRLSWSEHPLERDISFVSDEETLPSINFTEEDLPPYQAETQPSIPHPPEKPVQPYGDEFLPRVEPVLPSEPTPALYNLSFACVMIPRFPHHHLTSDLAARMGEWIPQICVAFGWRVERLSIRPEYVQFMVNVPPATSPGYLMRIITKVTSQRVFHGFPRFQDENPSGEFWAPGYMIISSNQLPPPRMVNDFISQTRKRQGFK
ncbi:MAG TPA: IS200/IS605 family transposase [Anaerolineales bacterium]|nr:IS200/IS605 family transposase [Anaerolineales bacterium]